MRSVRPTCWPRRIADRVDASLRTKAPRGPYSGSARAREAAPFANRRRTLTAGPCEKPRRLLHILHRDISNKTRRMGIMHDALLVSTKTLIPMLALLEVLGIYGATVLSYSVATKLNGGRFANAYAFLVQLGGAHAASFAIDMIRLAAMAKEPTWS